MNRQLRREVGPAGAVLLGLGAMVGTGVFVSIGIAAGVAGPSVIVAVLAAALLATCNALSSAQLAASMPVSGGTYEYGYEYLTPRFGFTAGWAFLLAKSASAATAALGFGGYVIEAFQLPPRFLIPLAIAAVLGLTLIVSRGIRRSNTVNTWIVLLTLGSLLFFVVSAIPHVSLDNFKPFVESVELDISSPRAILYATALMFVAYTGYGRIATLGEEVKDPRRTIPIAITVTMLVTVILYTSVAATAVGAIGSRALYESTDARAAPLAVIAEMFSTPGATVILSIGAVTAMLGVLLNLILGLSRVLLAMGRRRDVPAVFGRLDQSGRTPSWAVPAVGLLIAGLVLVGDVKVTWSFSAFTVLIYYAITNLSAIVLPADHRRFPIWISVLGLVGCLGLAFWVEQSTWLLGAAVLGIGLVWHEIAKRLRAQS